MRPAHRLTHLHAPVALQATTGEDWLSQVHRQVLGLDGCVWCRTETVVAPRFGCSTGGIEEPDGSKTDAALPFLSASSGLMLATTLQRLAAGELTEGAANCWSWDFESEERMASRPSVRSCQEECALIPNQRLRERLTLESRWARLAQLCALWAFLRLGPSISTRERRSTLPPRPRRPLPILGL